ncbi:MAG: hypothetical protein KY432_02100 [Acidobacteria bacterium]|nr:hypothetical protein [Acidobacteriota bacterium]
MVDPVSRHDGLDRLQSRQNPFRQRDDPETRLTEEIVATYRFDRLQSLDLFRDELTLLYPGYRQIPLEDRLRSGVAEKA